ncbi:MAG TPA: hypothetical protein VIP51_15940 [Eoetvoesiella sp.]
MNARKGRDEDIRRASYERETSDREHTKNKEEIKGGRRSLMGAPVDPKSPTTDINIPPGIEPEDVADPGKATPGAPPVDNRSGKKK